MLYQCKQRLVPTKFAQIDQKNIIIVKLEIERWYLAGITNAKAREIGLAHRPNTESISKEKFDSLIPRSFNSRIDFMNRLLNDYDFEAAKRQNTSLGYFALRFGI